MSLLINDYYRFGKFTFDTEQRDLARAGKHLALTPKLFDTLLILVADNGPIVAEEELMNQSFVEDGNLTVNIQQLRKFLGDVTRTDVFLIPRHLTIR